MAGIKPADCSAYGEGKLELGGKLGQVKTYSAGRINYLPADTTTELDVVFGIDFFLENSIWELINKSQKTQMANYVDISNVKVLQYPTLSIRRSLGTTTKNITHCCMIITRFHP